jgi:dTDP-4-dehydrorhamnose 3,5-epimerase
VRIVPTAVDVVFEVHVDAIEDERGHFGRSWCSREFADAGLHDSFVQENIGFSHKAGTLRGLHFQCAPYEEAKLVRCTRGAVWDVAVDVRPDSPTRGVWIGAELTAENRKMLYVGAGCAHGYLTLSDASEVTYLTSEFYAPDSASGIRYDDPTIGIEWPAAILLVSERDRTWPGLDSTHERGIS